MDLLSAKYYRLLKVYTYLFQTLVAAGLPVEEYNQTQNNLSEATETLYSAVTPGESLSTMPPIFVSMSRMPSLWKRLAGFDYRNRKLLTRLTALSGVRALERDEDIPGPTLCLERDGPALVQVRCVVARRQRVAVQGIDPLPRLPL